MDNDHNLNGLEEKAKINDFFDRFDTNADDEINKDEFSEIFGHIFDSALDKANGEATTNPLFTAFHHK